jgi:hypothetical protein
VIHQRFLMFLSNQMNQSFQKNQKIHHYQMFQKNQILMVAIENYHLK